MNSSSLFAPGLDQTVMYYGSSSPRHVVNLMGRGGLDWKRLETRERAEIYRNTEETHRDTNTILQLWIKGWRLNSTNLYGEIEMHNLEERDRAEVPASRVYWCRFPPAQRFIYLASLEGKRTEPELEDGCTPQRQLAWNRAPEPLNRYKNRDEILTGYLNCLWINKSKELEKLVKKWQIDTSYTGDVSTLCCPLLIRRSPSTPAKRESKIK